MSLEDDVRRLSRARPFDALPREALQLLAFSCQKRRIGAGTGATAGAERSYEPVVAGADKST